MQSLIEHYQTQYHSLNDISLNHFIAPKVRQEALNYFFQHGFPTVKDSFWRTIARSAITQKPFYFLPSLIHSHLSLPAPLSPNSLRLVFINGFFSSEYSDSSFPSGVSFHSLLTKNIQDVEQGMTAMFPRVSHTLNSFSALNTVFSRDGSHIVIESNHIIEPVIELLFLNTIEHPTAHPAWMMPSGHFIHVGADSHVQFVERHLTLGSDSDQNTCTNIASYLQLDTASHVGWHQEIAIGDKAYHVGQLSVAQSNDSLFKLGSHTSTGRLIRRTIDIDLAQPRAGCYVKGLNTGAQNQKIDYQVLVRHSHQQTESNVHYRSVADDHSHIALGAEVNITAGTSQIKSSQDSHNLLLSKDAEIDNQPRLTILADDVSCTHGATIGQLEAQAIHYLNTRGMTIEQAKDMLITGFTQVILKEITSMASPQLAQALQVLYRSSIEDAFSKHAV